MAQIQNLTKYIALVTSENISLNLIYNSLNFVFFLPSPFEGFLQPVFFFCCRLLLCLMTQR